MREEWENYLLGKVELRDLHTRYKKKPMKAKGFGILDGVVQTTAPQSAEASSINKQEHDALLASASAIRNRAKKEEASGDDPQHIVSGKGRRKGIDVPENSLLNAEASGVDKLEPTSGTETRSPSKRNVAVGDDPQLLVGKGRGKGKGKVQNRKAPASVKTSRTEVQTIDTLVIPDSEDEGEADEIHQVVAADSSDATLHVEGFLRRHTEQFKSNESKNAKSLPPVHFYALESGQPILDILRPSRIVVYHPDMTFVREIEVYKAENPSKNLKVYFLFYEDSSEVQKFEASIRRENGAFESLIRQKSLMMIPVDQDGNCMGLESSLEPEVSSQNSITRKAGGRREVEKQMQSASDIGDDVTPNSIISKLSLLVLHFPRLRIIWSRSLHATAEIFATLKANQDEPDETKASRVGVPSEDGIIEDDVRAENYNTSAVEFLRRLPGVTDSNYRSIMDGCKSLSELALMPLEKLAELTGGHKEQLGR